MNYAGLQSRLKLIGEEGCHFLYLCSVAEEYNAAPVDIDSTYTTALRLGYISQDCTVNDGLALLKYLTGASWKRDIYNSQPKDNTEGWVEEVWLNARTGLRHYRSPNFDTLTSSVTVKEGSIEKWYVWKVV